MLLWTAAWAQAQELAWGPCDPTVAVQGALCTSVGLPLDAFDPYKGSLPMAVALLPAAQQPARGQLWFVTGGPGDAGIDELALAAGLRELVPDLDLLTFDHRGTGRSGRLTCPAEERGSDGGAEITDGEWPACMAYVGEAYAGELEWLTTTRAALDLIQLTSATVHGEQEVYWWGVSYGTYLIQRALHFVPDGPDGVILDGLVPADWTFDEFDQGLDQTARQWLEACEQDEDCASHFAGSPLETAERTLAAVPRRCEALGLDAPAMRELTAELLLRGEPYASLVPALWVRLERCQSRDRRALSHLLEALPAEDALGRSAVLQRHIAYGDLWAQDAPGESELEEALEGYISTASVSASLAEQVDDWPLIPPHEFDEDTPLWGYWPEVLVPVLALHGGFDPTMPLSRTAGYGEWLDRPRQHVVHVPLAEHVTLNKGDCPASLYAQFLQDPRDPLDTSCLAEMPAYDWEGEASFNEEVLGVADRFGDERRCGCRTGAHGGWAGLLFLLAGRFGRRSR
jgi:pimeloyl-ACP methyl ester carboxylesterase